MKRGVWEAGGFPLEFNTISLGEMLMKPTTMLYRNLMAMEVEESIRAYPLDGVVLLCGCDKTTPAQLMGAASVDVPAIMVPGGPMLSGMWHGPRTRLRHGRRRKMWEEVRAGRLGEEEWCEIESCVARSAGHCGVMGTASTMASLAEGLGMTLPGAADIPAVDSRRMMIAEQSGRRIVGMVREGLRPSPHHDRRGARERHPRCSWRWAGRRMPSCTWWPLPGGWGSNLPLSSFDDFRRHHALHRQRKALGKIPDGRIQLRRRCARRAEGNQPAAAFGRADRQRQNHGRKPEARGVLQSRGHPASQRAALPPEAASWC